jgi:EAL domain-containing protein (putative c-di-GMP-specific phosphodiesterase class I)
VQHLSRRGRRGSGISGGNDHRWRNPAFVPLAESTGMIRELTDFVLRTAVADCARLSATEHPMCVAVNISATDMAASGFVDKVKAILTEFDVDASSLAFEVTDSAIIRSTATAISVLTELRERGIRLSIDDYGTASRRRPI